MRMNRKHKQNIQLTSLPFPQQMEKREMEKRIRLQKLKPTSTIASKMFRLLFFISLMKNWHLCVPTCTDLYTGCNTLKDEQNHEVNICDGFKF